MTVIATVTRALTKVIDPGAGTASKQLYFAILLAAFTALIAISRPEEVLTGPYLAAMAVLVAATVIAFLAPWDGWDPRWAAVVPMIDFVALGLARDSLREATTAISLLAVIPTLWLAGRLRLAGTLMATTAVIVAIAVPSLVRAPYIDSLTIAHSLLLPFTVLQLGILASGALKVLDGQAEAKAATLAEKERLLEQTAAWERLLENILDTVDMGIVVVDRDGHDLLMNRAQRQIHDLATPDDLDDPNEAQLLLRYPGTAVAIPPPDRPVRRAVMQETFSNYVVSIGTPEGNRKFSTSARQILDRHGNRDGAVVVFSDVTTYVEAARSQQQFVAAVSHELRTPLSSVIGYLELARDDLELSEETASYLTVANRNAEQLLTIVSDLLQDQVTRSTTEGLTLRPRQLSTIAGEVVESFAPHAAKEGIELVSDLTETPQMPLDDKRITQALDNLVSNALKYTPRGGRVRVHVCVIEGAVELNVIDTGIGMADQEQTDLFTDFYRTQTARQARIDGHGIGLALARRIVLAHGGQISVRSMPGEGSTFTIRLPLEAEATRATRSGS